MAGIDQIAAERKRQVEKEGWTPDHDDQHEGGCIAQAAAAYAIHGTSNPGLRAPDRRWDGSGIFPWGAEWWKPGHFTPSEMTTEDRIRCLEKAGALCAAEIDRLQRLKEKS